MSQLLNTLIVTLLTLTFSTVQAVTFNVNDFNDPAVNGCSVGSCSLREAITDANGLPGFHTVNLPPGDYQISGNDIAVNAPGGITILGAGDWQTTIDANNLSRIFNVTDTTLQIFNVTITNGLTTDDGGAIFASNSNLSVFESTLSHNQAGDDGGAIFAVDTTATGLGMIIRRSRINTNTADRLGAALVCASNQFCTIEDTTIDNNSSSNTSSTIIDAFGAARVDIIRSTISNNTSSDANVYINIIASQLNIISSTFSANQSQSSSVGPLIIVNAPEAILSNNTLTANQGLNASDGNLRILSSNVTISANIIDNNCNFSNNTLVSGGYNIATSSCTLNDPTDSTNIPPSELHLMPLNDNNGFTYTHALGTGSLAINHQNLACNGRDQRGIARNNPNCDVGAFQTESFCSSPGISIPDGSTTGITDSFTIHDISTITDLDIWVDISHGYVNDLEATLTHTSSGLEVTLINNIMTETASVCNGDDIKLIFDQDELFHQVEGSCHSYPNDAHALPAFPGNFARYRPDDEGGHLLDIFDGMSLAGEWTLKVVDSVGFQQGTLNKWCVLPTTDFVDHIFSNGFD